VGSLSAWEGRLAQLGRARGLAPLMINGDMEESALGAVADLKDVLARERAAISRLDAGALETLAQEKRAAADALQCILHPNGPTVRPAGEPPVAERRRLRNALLGLRGEAEANRALLDDAIGAIAEARGLYRDSGTYDARARRRHSYTARAGRGF